MPEQPTRLLASYGRRRGRRLRPTKQGLIDHLLPELKLELPEKGTLDLAALFPEAKEYWLEVGFGGGEHLAHQAGLYRDIGIIGCEPYINGMAALLTHIRDHALTNIRLWEHDARLAIDKLPDHSISKVFVLYPDPWPKARHNKRRLISAEFLNHLQRIMKPGAELRLATDHAGYCTWMLERLLAHNGFQWKAKHCDHWLTPPADWIPTRYEQKRLAGVPTYLNFTRI